MYFSCAGVAHYGAAKPVLPTHSYNAAPIFICTPLSLQAPRLKSYRRLGISRFVGMLAYENEMVRWRYVV